MSNSRSKLEPTFKSKFRLGSRPKPILKKTNTNQNNIKGFSQTKLYNNYNLSQYVLLFAGLSLYFLIHTEVEVDNRNNNIKS